MCALCFLMPLNHTSQESTFQLWTHWVLAPGASLSPFASHLYSCLPLFSLSYLSLSLSLSLCPSVAPTASRGKGERKPLGQPELLSWLQMVQSLAKMNTVPHSINACLIPPELNKIKGMSGAWPQNMNENLPPSLWLPLCPWTLKQSED